MANYLIGIQKTKIMIQKNKIINSLINSFPKGKNQIAAIEKL